MASHDCGVWNTLGVGCPMGLVRNKMRELLDIEEGSPAERDPLVAVPPVPGKHRRAKASQNTQVENLTLAVLLELARQAGDRLPEPVKMPVEMMREAWQGGARGKELALWIAAGAATLAIGVRFGPQAALAVPVVVKWAQNAQKGVFTGTQTGARMTGGRGGFHFNWANELQKLLVGGRGSRYTPGNANIE